MQRRALGASIEWALREQLALTDRPRAQLNAIAEELFAALDSVAVRGGVHGAETMDAVRREFQAAIARVRREYEAGKAPPQAALFGVIGEGPECRRPQPTDGGV